MKFITKTGSHYEIDPELQKIRRLSGKLDPSNRQGKDGEWREYTWICPIVVGNQVIIYWGSNVDLLPETKKAIESGMISCAIPATITSQVISIEEDELDWAW